VDVERRHLVRARRDLQRNVLEAAHDLGARGRAAEIHEIEILGPADIGAELLRAIDEHHERLPRLTARG